MAKIWTRNDWGALPPRSSVTPMRKVNQIIFHHSVTGVTTDPARDIRTLQSIHFGNRWADIGYHLIVHPSGIIAEGRIHGGRPSVGAHTVNHNSTALGICVIGNYLTDHIGEDLLKLMGEAINYAISKDWVSSRPAIGGHKDFQATQCPAKLYDHLNYVRGLIGGGIAKPVKPSTPNIIPAIGGGFPKFGGRIIYNANPDMQGEDIRIWQQRMRERGWRISVDGIYGNKSESICRQFQNEKGLAVDGAVGINTWNATWNTPIN